MKPQLETTNLILDASGFEEYTSEAVIVCGDGAEKSIPLIQKPQFEYFPSKKRLTRGKD